MLLGPLIWHLLTGMSYSDVRATLTALARKHCCIHIVFGPRGCPYFIAESSFALGNAVEGVYTVISLIHHNVYVSSAKLLT